MAEPLLEQQSPIKSSPSPCSKSPSPVGESAKLENAGFSVANLLGQAQKGSLNELEKFRSMSDQLNECLKKLQPSSPMAVEMPLMSHFLLWSQFNARMLGQAGTLLPAAALAEESKKALPANPLSFLHSVNASASNSEPGKQSRESSNPSPALSDHSTDHNEDADHVLHGGIRKKKTRTVFSRSQVSQLEMSFNQHKYLNSSQRSHLAQQLGLTEVQVKIWFQNRRNKWKRSQNGEPDLGQPIRPTHPAGQTVMAQLPTMVQAGAEDAVRMLLQQQQGFGQAQFLTQPSPLLSAMSPLLSHFRPQTEPEVDPNNVDFARFLAIQAQNWLTQAGVGSSKNSTPLHNSTPTSSASDGKQQEWKD